ALTGLEPASRHRLAEHWAEYFGAAPPPRTSRSLMIRAVAYKLQERVLGGLSAATRRLLAGQGPVAVRRRRAVSPRHRADPREAGEAFIRSQRGEGWRLIETAYDDGGLSGSTLDRRRTGFELS